MENAGIKNTHQEFNIEKNRLKSLFGLVEITSQDKYTLAKAGCFFNVNLQKLQCFKCQKIFCLSSSMPEDIITHECADRDNIRLTNVEISSPCVVYTEEELNHEEYRIATFSKWPISNSYSSAVLAKQGFYFDKNPDHIRCFYCGFGMGNWQASADPTKAHRIFMPLCQQNNNDCTNKVQQYLQSSKINAAIEAGFTREQIKALLISRFNDSGTIHNYMIEELVEDLLASQYQNIKMCEPMGAMALPSNGIVMDLIEKQQRDYEMMKEKEMCKICMDSPKSIAFIPCGHFSCCETCAENMNKCPICQQNFQSRVKIFAN